MNLLIINPTAPVAGQYLIITILARLKTPPSNCEVAFIIVPDFSPATGAPTLNNLNQIPVSDPCSLSLYPFGHKIRYVISAVLTRKGKSKTRDAQIKQPNPRDKMHVYFLNKANKGEEL